MSEAERRSGAAASAPHAAPLIAAKGVTRILSGTVPVTLVHDMDLAIAEVRCDHRTIGLGQSSLLYLLGLLDLPTAGEVRIRGRATAHMDKSRALANPARYARVRVPVSLPAAGVLRWKT